VDAAAYALIGVAVGGGFGIARDRLVEGRRERAERNRVRRDELRDGRVACLLVADELDTLSVNFKLLADLGRAPQRPISESPFLSTHEWHAHKGELGRIVDQLDTWKALASLYHNADSMRVRLVHDGPEAPIPSERLPTCREDADGAAELADIVYDAVAVADRRLGRAVKRQELSAEKPERLDNADG
jgi:hypothetical protein